MIGRSRRTIRIDARAVAAAVLAVLTVALVLAALSGGGMGRDSSWSTRTPMSAWVPPTQTPVIVTVVVERIITNTPQPTRAPYTGSLPTPIPAPTKSPTPEDCGAGMATGEVCVWMLLPVGTPVGERIGGSEG